MQTQQPSTVRHIIKSVYTKNNTIYTTEPEPETKNPKQRLIVYSCEFSRSDFGSIYVKKPKLETILEVYPNSIEAIVHTQEIITY